MQKSRRVLNIFLASPSDVAAERVAAEEVVAGINRIIGETVGWEIDLHKWEDTSPGFGRPQEIINSRVDECELFIGLLWKWWGQPTGNYSSGFEEEFERAKARRREQGQPEIWLFFKTFDPESLNDPGFQLNKVSEFQRSQIALREVLFHEVGSTEEWKVKLREWLSVHVLKLALLAHSVQQQLAVAVPVLGPDDTKIEPPSDATNAERIPQQLAAVSSRLSRVIESGNLEFSRQDADLLREFEVARLFLLSATWMSRRCTGEVLGTHEMNLLYKHREQLDVTSDERYQLLRTMVGNSGGFTPGWFWFRELTPKGITDRLLVLINLDSSQDVRAQALTVLAGARIEISQELLQQLPLNDDSLTVRTQAYEYLASVGDESELSLLESLATDEHDLSAGLIRTSRLKLLARLDASRALSEVIADEEYISDDDARTLQGCVSQIDEGILLKGLESSSEEIRKLSLKELSRRRRVPMPLAKKLTRDASLAIRAMAFQNLATQGALPDFEEVRKKLSRTGSPMGKIRYLSDLLYEGGAHASPDPDSIIVSFYRTLTTEKLLQAIDWFSVDGALAYRALALDRYDEVSPHLRADIANGFERIKEGSVERMKSEYGPELWEKHSAGFHKYDDFRRSRFTQAALIGVASNGQPSDADLARPYLSDSDSSLRDAAAAVVCKFGNSQDVDALLKITTEAWGDVRQEAAAAALRFSRKPIETAYELGKNSDSDVVKIAFGYLFAQDFPEVRSMFRDLLHDEGATSRTRAVYYCSIWMNQNELELLLEDYIAGETYYYDVVTWLDRLLYSPRPLREMFIEELKKEATGMTE